MPDLADKSNPTANPDRPYANLDPDAILRAIEQLGLVTDGTLLALNSYENRVYQVGLEEADPVVVKFYRTGRWSDESILEEHAFTQELADAELSVVAPMDIDGQTLFKQTDMRYSVFPRQGGHPPDLENEDNLAIVARTMGRLHNVGRQADFQHRPQLTCNRMGHDSRKFLLEHSFIPVELETAYDTLTQDLLSIIDEKPELAASTSGQHIRLHGDCHMGNVLWRDQLPHFVDFDDCVSGPAIQDMWMLLSGDRQEQSAQLQLILDEYQTFCDFDVSTIGLIEPLRTLRMMHHAAWIARRWDDPAFPAAFSWFGTERYWSEHLLSLREQFALLQEAPLGYWP